MKLLTENQRKQIIEALNEGLMLAAVVGDSLSGECVGANAALLDSVNKLKAAKEVLQ